MKQSHCLTLNDQESMLRAPERLLLPSHPTLVSQSRTHPPCQCSRSPSNSDLCLLLRHLAHFLVGIVADTILLSTIFVFAASLGCAPLIAPVVLLVVVALVMFPVPQIATLLDAAVLAAECEPVPLVAEAFLLVFLALLLLVVVLDTALLVLLFVVAAAFAVVVAVAPPVLLVGDALVEEVDGAAWLVVVDAAALVGVPFLAPHSGQDEGGLRFGLGERVGRCGCDGHDGDAEGLDEVHVGSGGMVVLD
jgi:hypothetical protein